MKRTVFTYQIGDNCDTDQFETFENRDDALKIMGEVIDAAGDDEIRLIEIIEDNGIFQYCESEEIVRDRLKGGV